MRINISIYVFLILFSFSGSAYSQSQAIPTYDNGAAALIRLAGELPPELAISQLALEDLGEVALTMTVQRIFKPGASFITGGSNQTLERVPLEDITYYQGEVDGFADSLVFLAVEPAVADFSGFVRIGDAVWDLELDEYGSKLISSAGSLSAPDDAIDLGDDAIEAPLVFAPDEATVSAGKTVVLGAHGGFDASTQSVSTTYRCTGFDSPGTSGWTIPGDSQCLIENLEIPEGSLGKFTLFGQDENEGNGDLVVQRGDPPEEECRSAGPDVDEVCDDISSGIVDVLVIAPDTELKFWLSWQLRNESTGFLEKGCATPSPGSGYIFTLEAREACVFSVDIPTDGLGTFYIEPQGDSTGNADLLVRRGDPKLTVCESSGPETDDSCSGIAEGPVEVVVSAPDQEVKFAFYYELAREALEEGYRFETVVAIDTDFALYSQVGDLKSLQNYFAGLFAFNNTVFEREVRTKLLIGDMRVRQTDDDDPYHTDTEQKSACRLAEFSQKWHTNEELSGLDRGLAAHFTNISFGGIANRPGLCSDSFEYDPVEIEDCPFDRYVSGDYSVTGVQAETANIGGSILKDNHFSAHEFGHNFNSKHTHCYSNIGGNSDPVDACYVEDNDGCWAGDETLPGLNSLTGGTSGSRNGSIMSYCHLLEGNTLNIFDTFGEDFDYGVDADRVPKVLTDYVGGKSLTDPSCVATVEVTQTSDDSDGDGYPDDEDAFPDDPNEWVDTDQDGIGNNADDDDDGDGVADADDAFPLDSSETTDTDKDGIGNNEDTDDDGDGYSDADELAAGTDPLDPNDKPNTVAEEDPQGSFILRAMIPWLLNQEQSAKEWSVSSFEVESLQSDEQDYRVVVLPADATEMEVFTEGGSDGDADLYVTPVSQYETNEENRWRCSASTSSSEERCNTADLEPLAAGEDYYVLVYAYEAFSNLKVTIRTR
jgi:hypothetical protein